MDEHHIEAKTIVDAKKAPIVAEEAMKLAMAASRIYAAKGTRIVAFTLKAGVLQDDATEEGLRKAIIGPSGNLRAPTLCSGKTWYVGFHPEMYQGLV